MKKPRLLSGFLATLMCLSLIPTSAFALSGVDNKTIEIGQLYTTRSPLITVNSDKPNFGVTGTLPNGLEFEQSSNSIKIIGSAKPGTVGKHTGITFSDDSGSQNWTLDVGKGSQTISVDFGSSKDVSTITLPPKESHTLDAYSKDAAGYQIESNHQPDLSYDSSNKAVATIDSSGNITTIKEGTTSIKINASSNESYKAAEKNLTLNVVKSSPTIKLSSSNPVGTVGSIGAQTITANVSGSYPETLDFTCSINGITKNSSVNGNGSISFNFAAAELNALREGSYDIYVSFDGTDKNKPISRTSIGKLVVESYSVSVSPSVKDFGTSLPDYKEISPATFTIENTGGNQIKNLSVALEGKNAANFTLNTDNTATSLNNNGRTSFTVKPKIGLAQGYYTANVKVSANSMTAVTREVSFTVNPPGFNASVSPSSYDFGTEEAGYTDISSETFTIKNTGTGDLTNLNVSLSGTNSSSFVLDTSDTATSLNKSGGNRTTTSFTIEPKEKLTVGTYNAEAKITATGLTEITVKVKFEVEKEDPNATIKVSEGKTGSWIIGSEEEYSIAIRGDYDKFKEVQVAGKKLNTKYYTVEKGSTIITFQPDYLKTLKKGKYKIKVLFSNGTADATLTIAETSNRFVDINPQDWYYDPIIQVVDNGLFEGVYSNNFSPNQPVTRGQFALVLAQLNGANLGSYSKSPFRDVDITSYYGKAIAWAVDKEVIAGTGNGNFTPEGLVTREQMAAILTTYIKNLKVKIKSTSSAKTFNDANKISSWAKDPVNSIQKYGLIGGKPGNVFDPQGTATRGEVAQIFSNILDATGK